MTLYHAEWFHDGDQAELIEIGPDDPRHRTPEKYARTALEAWRKLVTTQLGVATAAALAYDDSRPEAAHREMQRAKIAIDFYFRSWTEEMEKQTEGG